MERISFEETIFLIDSKHQEENIIMFGCAEGKPQKIKELWHELAVKMADKFKKPFSASFIKNKYNQLLSKYRMEHIKYKKSGEGTMKWIYSKKFHETFPKNSKLQMENVFELGSGVQQINNPITENEGRCAEECLKQHENSDKKESLKEIKYKLYKSLLESETRSRKKPKIENKKLKKEIKILKSDMQELKEMTLNIFEILKKDKNKE